MPLLTRSSQELTLGSKNHGLAKHHVASAATPSAPLSPECGAVTPLDTEPGPGPAPGAPPRWFFGLPTSPVLRASKYLGGAPPVPRAPQRVLTGVAYKYT